MSNSNKSIIDLIKPLADQAGMDADTYYQVAYNLVFANILSKPDAVITTTHMYQLISLCKEYGVSPLHKHVYAIKKGVNIMFSLTIDGWMKVLLSCAEYKNHEIIYSEDLLESQVSGHTVPQWIQMKIYFKDGREFLGLREYYLENQEATDAWFKRPIRLLTHRAACQSIRYALNIGGFSGDDLASNNDVQNSETPMKPVVLVDESDNTSLSDSNVQDESGLATSIPTPTRNVVVVEDEESSSMPIKTEEDKPKTIVEKYDYSSHWLEFISEQRVQHGDLADLAGNAFLNFIANKQSSINSFTEKQWISAQQFVLETIQNSKVEQVEQETKQVSISQENQDFSIIPVTIRQSIERAAQSARKSNDLSLLSNLSSFFQNDIELAFLAQIIEEVKQDIAA